MCWRNTAGAMLVEGGVLSETWWYSTIVACSAACRWAAPRSRAALRRALPTGWVRGISNPFDGLENRAIVPHGSRSGKAVRACLSGASLTIMPAFTAPQGAVRMYQGQTIHITRLDGDVAHLVLDLPGSPVNTLNRAVLTEFGAALEVLQDGTLKGL